MKAYLKLCLTLVLTLVTIPAVATQNQRGTMVGYAMADFESLQELAQKLADAEEKIADAEETVANLDVAGVEIIYGGGAATAGLPTAALALSVGSQTLFRVAAGVAGLGLVALADAIITVATDGEFNALRAIYNNTIRLDTPAHAATLTQYYQTPEGFERFLELTPEQAELYMTLDGDLSEMVKHTANFLRTVLRDNN